MTTLHNSLPQHYPETAGTLSEDVLNLTVDSPRLATLLGNRFDSLEGFRSTAIFEEVLEQFPQVSSMLDSFSVPHDSSECHVLGLRLAERATISTLRRTSRNETGSDRPIILDAYHLGALGIPGRETCTKADGPSPTTPVRSTADVDTRDRVDYVIPLVPSDNGLPLTDPNREVHPPDLAMELGSVMAHLSRRMNEYPDAYAEVVGRYETEVLAALE